jgi:hypothetical protein
MGLAKVNVEGTLEITQAGTHRFTVERHRSASVLAGASPTAGGHITWRLDDQSRS